MPIQSREQLKNYFRNGALVKERHFVDLIDSTFNKASDNFDSNTRGGLSLTPSLPGKRFISFFKNTDNQSKNIPSFGVQLMDGVNGTDEGLSLAVPDGKGDFENILFLKRAVTKTGNVLGRVGINTTNPLSDLDVNGSLSMKTRIGRYSDSTIDRKKIIADGKWHKLLTNLKGFNSFEIMSAVSSPDGKYAMHYSVIMNATGKSKNIKPSHREYKSWWYRLQMRWVIEEKGTYGLEIRTKRHYKNSPMIYSMLTKLWN